MNKKIKKFLSLVLNFIIIFSTSVFAKDVDIKVVDAKVISKSNTAEVETPTIDGNNINTSVIFNEQGDFVTYEVTIKNNDDESWKINSVEDNYTKDNLKIYYEYDKELIEKGKTSKIKVTITYKKKLVNTESLNIDDLKISLNLINESGNTTTIGINNPNTRDGILKYLVLLIVAVTGLIFVVTKKRYKGLKVGKLLVLIAILMSPFMILAEQKFQMNINIKTLTLKSEYLDYEVSFNTDGAGNVDTKTVTYGQSIGELPELRKDGYTFNGWKDQDGNTVTKNTVVKGKLELEADFTAIEYNITYNLDNGKVTPSGANPTKYTIEDEFDLVNPTRKGYTFAGWTLGDSEDLYTRVTISHETGAKAYTAHWSKNQNTKYYVNHKYPNLDGTYVTECEELEGPTDTEVTAPFKPKTGFDNPTESQNLTISADEDSEVTYTYTRHEYNLTLNDDIETTFTNSKYPYQTEITLTAKDKPNYEFTGWSNGEATKTITFRITEDTEVYPLYKATGFTVTYNANGGNFSDEATLKNDVMYALNETTNKNEVVVGTYEIPVKEDYRFKGWYLDSNCTPGNEIDIEKYELTEDIEVYANWYYGEATFMDGRLISGCDNLKDDGTCSSWTFSKMKINISSTSFIRSNTLPEEYNFEEYIVSSDDSDLPIYMWYEEDTKTTKWYSDATKVFLNPNSYSMFKYLENLKKLELKDFDTSKVTNMGYLFNNCRSVEELDVSHFDTSNVTRMDGMFSACSKLNSLDVSNFDTEKVTNMQMMFGNCPFAELDVYNFNTSNVTNMQQMFMNDDKLKELDLSNFNTSKVINMYHMFGGCTNLEKLNISRFDTNKVTNMSGMFYNCDGLEELDLSHFDTSNVTRMDAMFSNCDGLEELDLSSFDTSKVTMMSDGYSYGIFSNCRSLKTIYASEKFDTSKANGIKMFYNCTSLVGGHGTVFNSSHVNKEYAHLDGGEHYPGYFTSKKNEYLIRFNPNNADDNLISFYVEEGSKLKFLPTPASTDGKFFVGWYTDKNYLVRVTEDTIPQGDAIYYARWIKSIASAEIIPDSVEINVGDEISLSINNVEEEYDIISDNSSIVKVDSNGKITGISKGETTITITGKVSKQTKIINVEVVQTEFTISFNSNGGGDVDSITVEAGDVISSFETPTAPTNKIFAGWYTGIDSGVRIDTPYTPEGNITLYAHWNNDSFPVVFSETGECSFNGASGVLTGDDCGYADGTNKYIDTGINLYNSTNHDKDYEIGFTIVSYNYSDQVSQATFVNTKLEGDNYPGLVFRRKDKEAGFDLSSRKTSSANARQLFNYGDVEKVKIYRITNEDTGVQEIFYSINDADKVKLNDLSSFNPTFDLSVWFGAAPSNATATSAQRYLVGTMKDMYIKVGTYHE